MTAATGAHSCVGNPCRNARAEKGQTTTEYLMIVGLITTVFVTLSVTTQRPFHAMMQSLLQCIADGTTNQLPCEQATTIGVRITATPPPPQGTLQQTMGQLQQIFNSVTSIMNTMLNGVQQTINNLRGAIMRPEPWTQT